MQRRRLTEYENSLKRHFLVQKKRGQFIYLVLFLTFHSVLEHFKMPLLITFNHGPTTKYHLLLQACIASTILKYSMQTNTSLTLAIQDLSSITIYCKVNMIVMIEVFHFQKCLQFHKATVKFCQNCQRSTSNAMHSVHQMLALCSMQLMNDLRSPGWLPEQGGPFDARATFSAKK